MTQACSLHIISPVSKIVPIPIVLYAFGAFASCVAEDFRVLLFTTAVASLLAVAAAFLIFPPKTRRFLVDLPH